jgi:sugar phosphate isomerase/epimerase
MRLACVPAGKGITDFPGIFQALQDQNYPGMILIEISGVHPDYGAVHETTMIQEGLLYLKSLRAAL